MNTDLLGQLKRLDNGNPMQSLATMRDEDKRKMQQMEKEVPRPRNLGAARNIFYDLNNLSVFGATTIYGLLGCPGTSMREGPGKG